MKDNAPLEQSAFCNTFAERAEAFDMDWELTPSGYRPKVVIMVSKYDHCLNDLLYRYRTAAGSSGTSRLR